MVLSYPTLETVECRIARTEVTFPYVPGLLSFRETTRFAPLSWRALPFAPTYCWWMARASPIRGVLALPATWASSSTYPAIGCAKSRLTGKFEEHGRAKGSRAELKDGDEVIGAALRTRDGTKPIFVSIGHKVDLGVCPAHRPEVRRQIPYS